MDDCSSHTLSSWAIDLESDSPIVPFLLTGEAEAYVAAQNRHQGRQRWQVIEDLTKIPTMGDNTPLLFPMGCQVSIAGTINLSCAKGLDVAAALLHAADGVRRISGNIIATPVDGNVVLEVTRTGPDRKSFHEWRFTAAASRRLAGRLATASLSCISIPKGP